jgi:putative addiction module component (TIGR02574 family)
MRPQQEVPRMSTDATTTEIIASALRLPMAQRAEVVTALQDSLIDESIDHGPAEPADEVEAAWREEIARRIVDVDSGRVTTIPAEEAERMIRGDAWPKL